MWLNLDFTAFLCDCIIFIENNIFVYFLTNQDAVFRKWAVKLVTWKKFADSDFVLKFEDLNITTIFSGKTHLYYVIDRFFINYLPSRTVECNSIGQSFAICFLK